MTSPSSSSLLSGAALARKRRREILLTHRGDSTNETLTTSETTLETAQDCHEMEQCCKKARLSPDDNAAPSEDKKVMTSTPTEPSVEPEAPKSKKKKSHKKATSTAKPQLKYDPDVPMSKEELAAWRKEARRVRNRESAAASRRKTRDRIEELEHELHEIKAKYAAAAKRILELEGLSCVPSMSGEEGWDNNRYQTPDTHSENVLPYPENHRSASPRIVSPSASPPHSPKISPAFLPSSLALSLSASHCHVNQQEGDGQKQSITKEHLIKTISRPVA